MERPHRTPLLLNAEIAAVVTAMRQNSKWALVPMRYTVGLRSTFHGPGQHPNYTVFTFDGSIAANALIGSMQDDEIGDDPLLEDFRLLRRRLFKLHGALRSIMAVQTSPRPSHLLP